MTHHKLNVGDTVEFDGVTTTIDRMRNIYTRNGAERTLVSCVSADEYARRQKMRERYSGHYPVKDNGGIDWRGQSANMMMADENLPMPDVREWERKRVICNRPDTLTISTAHGPITFESQDLAPLIAKEVEAALAKHDYARRDAEATETFMKEGKIPRGSIYARGIAERVHDSTLHHPNIGWRMRPLMRQKGDHYACIDSFPLPVNENEFVVAPRSLIESGAIQVDKHGFAQPAPWAAERHEITGLILHRFDEVKVKQYDPRDVEVTVGGVKLKGYANVDVPPTSRVLPPVQLSVKLGEPESTRVELVKAPGSKACDCGGAKARTTCANWCSSR